MAVTTPVAEKKKSFAASMDKRFLKWAQGALEGTASEGKQSGTAATRLNMCDTTGSIRP